MSQFTDFGLNPALVKAIKEMGFENPMPIQEKAIPVLLERDVVMVWSFCQINDTNTIVGIFYFLLENGKGGAI